MEKGNMHHSSGIESHLTFDWVILLWGWGVWLHLYVYRGIKACKCGLTSLMLFLSRVGKALMPVYMIVCLPYQEISERLTMHISTYRLLGKYCVPLY
jgi:hypothetical protein